MGQIDARRTSSRQESRFPAIASDSVARRGTVLRQLDGGPGDRSKGKRAVALVAVNSVHGDRDGDGEGARKGIECNPRRGSTRARRGGSGRCR